MAKLSLIDVCAVIRSKQAGPFRLTFDLMFKDKEIYEKVKKSGVINPELIAKTYGVDKDKITNFIYFDPADSIKVTMIRPRVAASLGDSDVYGCQQHAPLLTIEFELSEGDE